MSLLLFVLISNLLSPPVHSRFVNELVIKFHFSVHVSSFRILRKCLLIVSIFTSTRNILAIHEYQDPNYMDTHYKMIAHGGANVHVRKKYTFNTPPFFWELHFTNNVLFEV